MAYTMGSLFYMLLRTKGVPCQEHEVKKDLARVGGYMKRVKDVESGGPEKKKLKVNTEASSRIVQGVVSHNKHLEAQSSAAASRASDAQTQPPTSASSSSSSSSASSSASSSSSPSASGLVPVLAGRLPPGMAQSSSTKKKRKRKSGGKGKGP
mmetsp:Transcript_17393/g.40843  ORF Transcript_17393/g.40843 Transcript_17393/m.40843 type:complete len:153 (-) Transcript_17393:140-598(-)